MSSCYMSRRRCARAAQQQPAMAKFSEIITEIEITAAGRLVPDRHEDAAPHSLVITSNAFSDLTLLDTAIAHGAS